MKLIAVSEIKDLRNLIRGLVAATLNEVTVHEDYKTITPYKQTLSIDGHLVTASYSPIFNRELDGDIPEHTCGHSKRVGMLELSCATAVPYQITFEEKDFGKQVPEDVIDNLTDGYISYLSHAACDNYLVTSGIAQEITDAINAGEFAQLIGQSNGLIVVNFSDNSHHVTYKSPEDEVLFTMNYLDTVGMYNLDPQFHVQAVASNYVRCYLDAMVKGYVMPDLQVNLGDKGLFQPTK